MRTLSTREKQERRKYKKFYIFYSQIVMFTQSAFIKKLSLESSQLHRFIKEYYSIPYPSAFWIL